MVIKEVRTRRELRQFVELPFRLHAADPIWTPPLKDDLIRSLSPKNPLWQGGLGERDLLLAFREGEAEPVGRIIAHVHHAQNARHGERTGFFGFLECPLPGVDGDLSAGREVAAALLDATAERHRARGLSLLRGPYELNIRECLGAVVSGFDEPASFSQSWNAPHLPPILESLGFEVVYRATTMRLDDVPGVDTEAMLSEKQRQWLADPRVRLRSWDMKNFERDLLAATDLLNRSFHDNFGFVAMSRPEVDFMAAPMKRVVRPELTVFLELDGEPIGVGMFLPDFNVLFRRMRGELFPLGWAQFLLGSRHLDAAVAQFIATSPAHQNKGLIRIVLADLLRRLQAAGFRTLDATWIGDVNVKSLAQTRAMGMREKHRLQLYARPL